MIEDNDRRNDQPVRGELPPPAKKGPPLTWITIGLLGCSVVFYTLSAVFVAVSSNTDDD